MNKTITVYAVVPNEVEFAVQYCDTEADAKDLAAIYALGAVIVKKEVSPNTVRTKRRWMEG